MPVDKYPSIFPHELKAIVYVCYQTEYHFAQGLELIRATSTIVRFLYVYNCIDSFSLVLSFSY